MKKLLNLFILTSFTIISAQTKLVSHHLELKKPKDSQQILNAVNTDTHEVYTIASDKENTTILKFNSALFFSDSLSVKRPDKEYTYMAGFSIEKNQNLYVYWASEELSKIVALQYDFNSKSILSTIYYTLPSQDESIIATFSENKAFYILSHNDKEQKLQLYTFKNGVKKENTFDFESFDFVTEKGKSVKLNTLLQNSPVQLIDSKSFNPLFVCAQKTKLYLTKNKLILTFDQDLKETRLFEIDLASYEMKEKKIVQPELKTKDPRSNSFIYGNNLYQLKLTDAEMALSVKDLNSDTLIKNYNASANDSIAFKNSPLYSQTGGQRPRILKNTKKFLDRLSDSDIGISVYNLNNNLFLTVGGTRSVATTGMIALGVAVGVGGIIAGTGADVDGLIDNSTVQSNYFESLISSDFQILNRQQGPLAVDLISQFMEEHDEISLESTFAYKNFFILSYYDSKTKEFTMRKFVDEDPSN